jgi:hypothetical protein
MGDATWEMKKSNCPRKRSMVATRRIASPSWGTMPFHVPQTGEGRRTEEEKQQQRRKNEQ